MVINKLIRLLLSRLAVSPLSPPFAGIAEAIIQDTKKDDSARQKQSEISAQENPKRNQNCRS